MRTRTAAAAASCLVALGAAYALKRFYSTASAADLRFLLAPTTWLVEVAGGHRFDWTSGGYLSAELRFVIAPACAGVNFLVVAFSSLVLAFVRPANPARHNAAILVAAAAAAAATTLLANALRILIAIPLLSHGVALGWLTGPRLHELVGVVVFLGMLLLLHLAARRLAGGPLLLWAPLLPYLGVVLVIPLVRGAFHRPEFWAHAGIVAGVLLAAAAGVWVAAPVRAPRNGRPRISPTTSRSRPAVNAIARLAGPQVAAAERPCRPRGASGSRGPPHRTRSHPTMKMAASTSRWPSQGPTSDPDRW